MVDDHDVLTTEEVAALLRVSTDTVLRDVRAGRIPARRVGKQYRFSRPAIMAWLEGGEVDPRYRRRPDSAGE